MLLDVIAGGALTADGRRSLSLCLDDNFLGHMAVRYANIILGTPLTVIICPTICTNVIGSQANV